MAQLHAREVTKSHVTEEPNEELITGEIVVRESGGGARAAEGADEEYDGIIVKLLGGDFVAEDMFEFREELDDFTYDPEDKDQPVLVPIQPKETGAVFSPYTVKDEDLPAPAIERNDTVGVITIDGEQHVVEDGYEADGTIYGEDEEGDFLPIGTAEVDPNTVFDEREKRVPIRVE